MRVAMLNNYWYLRGGSERVCLEEASRLETLGHAVFPFSRRHPLNPPVATDRFFPPDLRYDEQVGAGARLRAAANLVYSREVRRQFGAFLDACRPDLIHAHNLYGRLTTSVLDEARQRRIPVVMTLHDYKLLCPSYAMLSGGKPCHRCRGGRFYHCVQERCHKRSTVASGIYALEAYMARWFDKYRDVRCFLCPSLFLCGLLKAEGYEASRVIHLPNGVDTAAYTTAETDEGYVLYVGRLSHEKGLETLLRSVSGFSMPLRVVGDGPLRRDCEQWASREAAGRVTFLGHLGGEALAAQYRGAACVVFPSEWYENAPMTLLEAAAYAKPVVATTAGGIPEIVKDGETGILYPAGDAVALRAGLEQMAQSPARRREMGLRARDRVALRFDIGAHMERLTGIYKQVLAA